jgi:single-stranded DNA-specific DHH superfamily exonuclease
VHTDPEVWEGLEEDWKAEIAAKDWRTPRPSDRSFAEDIANRLKIDPVLALRLLQLGIPEGEIEAFLHPSVSHIRSFEQILPSLDTPGAILTLREQLASSRIAVFADYDVDGSASGEILRRLFEAWEVPCLLGFAKVEDGFGLSKSFVEEARQWKADWLITVDCGSTQNTEVSMAQGYGLKVIVLDHHEMDPANPAEYHFNPQFARYITQQKLSQWIASAQGVLDQVQKIRLQAQVTAQKGPAPKLDEYAIEARRLLEELSKYGIQEAKLQNGIQKALKRKELLQTPDSLTGAGITWIFAQALWREAPEWWYQEPLYLAGLGIVADMGSMRVVENRAFCRLGSPHPPAGIQKLAEHLEEDPQIMTQLIRTRAALNMPKRTTKISSQLVSEVYSNDPFSIARLAAEYVQASGRKDLMVAKACKQAGPGKWALAILDEFADDAGQSGVVAQKLTREFKKPALVFACRPDGNYKFSARNIRNNPQKLGELCSSAPLQMAAQICKDGEWTTSLGGHSDVLSGACAKEKVSEVIEVMQDWLGDIPPFKVKNQVWVTERKIAPSRVKILLEDTKLLEPIGGDIWGMEVSIEARIVDLDVETGDGLLELADQSQWPVKLDQAAYPAGQAATWWEWKWRVRSGKWWLKEAAKLEPDLKTV